MKLNVSFPVPGAESVTDAATKKWIEEVLQPSVSGWAQNLTQTLSGMIDEKHAPILIPSVTIDVGSQDIVTGSAANAWNAFDNQKLPNTAATTSNTYQTALNYTGRGVVTLVAIVAQVAAQGSTAAGASVQITIDGNVVYSAAANAAVNNIRMIVGSIVLIDSANSYYEMRDDPIGLPFNKTCKIEYKSGTNGQGVTIGWKVAKKL